MVGTDGRTEGGPSKSGADACAAETAQECAKAARDSGAVRRATAMLIRVASLEPADAPAHAPGENAARDAPDSFSERTAKPRPQRARRKSPAASDRRDTGEHAGQYAPAPQAAATEQWPSGPQGALPHAGAESDLLRAIYEELRGLRHEVRQLHSKPSHAPAFQSARAVSLETAQALLGCGRSRLFERLRSGTLRRAPRMGKEAMVSAASLEALLEGLHREPVPKLKRKPPVPRDAGRKEKAAILKLIRRA